MLVLMTSIPGECNVIFFASGQVVVDSSSDESVSEDDELENES
jgi:hypothetical protein